MISVLAPTVLGAVLFKWLPRELKVLAIFIFLTCLLEAFVYVTWQLNVNNQALFHLFTYIEFGCLSLIYFILLRAIRIVRYAIIILGAVFFSLSMYILFKWEYWDSYNSVQRGLEHIIVLMYMILFLFLFSRRLPEERFLLKPYFILSCGFFIYFAVTFLVLLDTKEYVNFNNVFNWSVHSVLNIFLNIVYFIVLWAGGKMVRR
jgi:hypothetical protein